MTARNQAEIGSTVHRMIQYEDRAPQGCCSDKRDIGGHEYRASHTTAT
jgi:hypothetical protein